MVQIKPADADRLLAKPDPAVRLVLIYGDDEGLVAERAEKFARAVTGADGDHLRLDPAVLSENPGRIADEARAIPMFGGKRAISIRISGNRSLEKTLEEILDNPPVDSWVIVIAGELRKSSPLRKLAETHGHAWAIPCYADSDRDLDRIIDEETRNAALTIAADARAALKNLIGIDRLISRSEVQKLCLYAADKGAIALDDVRAVVGEASAFAVDETVDAMAEGDSAALDRGYRRLLASGTPGFVVAGAALRHFNFLQKARAQMDGGESAGEPRPPRRPADLPLLAPEFGGKADRALVGRPRRARPHRPRSGDARQPPPRQPVGRSHRPGAAARRYPRSPPPAARSSACSERLLEPRQRKDRVVDALDAGEELAPIHGHDLLAGWTGEQSVHLEPADTVFGLVTAVGAGDADHLRIEEVLFHGRPFST